MKLSLAVIPIFMVAYCCTLTTGHKKVDYFGSLIGDLYKRRNTDGILVVLSTNDLSFKSFTFWHEISRIMSNQGRATDIGNFQELTGTLQWYQHHNVRPLLVVHIRNMREVDTFARITKTLNMNYRRWVILFSGDSNGDPCPFCRQPLGNPFNLKFNSEVIVVCCNTTIIEEWWTITGNHTEVAPIAQWIDKHRGIRWLSNKFLYERRSSLEGRPFRIGIVKGSTDIWKENHKLGGYLGRVVTALSQAMNFTISSIKIERAYGRWDPEISEWNGVLGKLRQNEVDMGVSSFIMTNERLEVVDFTLATVRQDSRLYIRKPGANNVQWNAYFEAFEMDVWLVITILIVTTPLLLTLIKYSGRTAFFPLLLEHYSSVWGIYCQQGLPEFPDETSLRIVCTSLSLSALVISIAYSASLTSFLAVSVYHLPFTSMEEFVALGTYKLIAIEDTADYMLFKESKGTLMRKMAALMQPREFLPETLYEGFQQVCSEKVAFHTTYEYRAGDTSAFIPCEMAYVKTRKIQASGIIMPLHSEYTAFVNYHLQRFKHSGLLDRWKREYRHQKRDPRPIYHPSVQLTGVTPILGVLTAGLLIAFIILLIERPYHRHLGSSRASGRSWSSEFNNFLKMYNNNQRKIKY